MKLGRAVVTGTPAFVASLDGSQWFDLHALGFPAIDTAEAIAAAPSIAAALAADRAAMAARVEPDRWLNPVVRPARVCGIGLNYMDHIRETGADIPSAPVVFAKFANSLSGPFDDVELHAALTSAVDYEVELAVIIGRPARDLTVEGALSAVFGYCVANDVSARDIQRSEPQFSRSKSLDGFCPMGPWITTADEVPDPQDLRVRSTVNGETRQDESTREMIFGVRDLLVQLSAGSTLQPGDTILTGTPHGVGFVMDPPRHLVPGDVVRCEIEGLGAIENRFVASPF